MCSQLCTLPAMVNDLWRSRRLGKGRPAVGERQPHRTYHVSTKMAKLASLINPVHKHRSYHSESTQQESIACIAALKSPLPANCIVANIDTVQESLDTGYTLLAILPRP